MHGLRSIVMHFRKSRTTRFTGRARELHRCDELIPFRLAHPGECFHLDCVPVVLVWANIISQSEPIEEWPDLKPEMIDCILARVDVDRPVVTKIEIENVKSEVVESEHVKSEVQL